MARIALNADLEALAARRRRAQAEVNELGLKIGATTTYLRDQLGQSKASSATHVGLSASHMTELLTKATESGTEIDDPLQRVPRLTGAPLYDFVVVHGGIRRIVASFADNDTLYMSGVSPAQLLEGDFLTSPNMMLEGSDGEWVVVDNVNVGYGGTGPSNAERTLLGLGIEPQLAWDIAYHRVSDVRFSGVAAVETMHTNEWPLRQLGTSLIVGDHFVVIIETDGQGQTLPQPPVDNGNPTIHSTDASTHLQRWLDFLDDPNSPQWVRGARRARIYLDWEAAAADGFADTFTAGSRRGRGIYTIILEQGDLQLWLELPESNDPSQTFSPETYAVLKAAGFYVSDYQVRDARGAFWRWLSALGQTRPTYVDLGNQPLRHPLPTSRLSAGR